VQQQADEQRSQAVAYAKQEMEIVIKAQEEQIASLKQLSSNSQVCAIIKKRA
jgi:hypothetical protein